MERPSVAPDVLPALSLERWLQDVRTEIEGALGRMLEAPGKHVDARWAAALEETRLYVTRSGKRVRPALLLAGWGLSGAGSDPPARLWDFAAAVEILHSFMLVHDDVADDADLRRGGPSLHRAFAPGKCGTDLAMVMGDYLFALAIEAMLGSGLASAPPVVRDYLGTCRQAAMGEYLDLDLIRVDLSRVTLSQTLRVARLKTSGPSFAAPLVAGGALAGGNTRILEALARVGMPMGLAFQLRDDLIGLYGSPEVAGKPCDSDLVQGKRTFPLIAAYIRSPTSVRRELDHLWAPGADRAGSLERVQGLVDRYGGRAATERAISRASRAARRALDDLPEAPRPRQLVAELIDTLSRRSS
jgi:geranylgeranyl diphosphate synthase type I